MATAIFDRLDTFDGQGQLVSPPLFTDGGNSTIVSFTVVHQRCGRVEVVVTLETRPDAALPLTFSTAVRLRRISDVVEWSEADGDAPDWAVATANRAAASRPAELLA